jgi:hypothetical protein
MHPAARRAAPELASPDVLRNPDRLHEAESILELVRERMRPLPQPPEYPTFEHLALDAGMLAVRAAQLIAEQPGDRYNPLFIHGPAGAGKSALATATALAFRERHAGTEVAYVSGEAFAAELIHVLERNQVESWRARYRRARLLVIDGVDALMETERAQEELFHLFDGARRAGVQFVFTAATPPRLCTAWRNGCARGWRAGSWWNSTSRRCGWRPQRRWIDSRQARRTPRRRPGGDSARAAGSGVRRLDGGAAGSTARPGRLVPGPRKGDLALAVHCRRHGGGAGVAMGIKGSLREASLADVCQLLALGQKTGCLSIADGAQFGQIFFDNGRITYARIVNRRDRLGDLLVRDGVLTREQLDDVLRRQAREPDRRVGELLVANSYISPSELTHYVRLQIEEAIYHLFTWSRGNFFFDVDARPSDADIMLAINPESLLLEAARRVDEWSLIEKKIPSFDLLFGIEHDRLAKSARS